MLFVRARLRIYAVCCVVCAGCCFTRCYVCVMLPRRVCRVLRRAYIKVRHLIDSVHAVYSFRACHRARTLAHRHAQIGQGRRIEALEVRIRWSCVPAACPPSAGAVLAGLAGAAAVAIQCVKPHSHHKSQRCKKSEDDKHHTYEMFANDDEEEEEGESTAKLIGRFAHLYKTV